MAQDNSINVKVDPLVKSEAEEILDSLGITPESAISMFYHQVVMHNGLPFIVKRMPDYDYDPLYGYDDEGETDDKPLTSTDLDGLISEMQARRQELADEEAARESKSLDSSR